ncbi:MAG TPA: prepilin-type N-terminal cleavage/methylation domain-containing protein [Thermoanaerobaculaceae bacterium]|nr:prepilin-type N-terminal cleavage/methylation domain-containing protein [Thermoanaerobaculaceae bacterium]
MRRPRMGRRHEAGLTLIEVLIAFFILFVTTLAILGMFSLALAVNQGSFARTDLSYAAEKVLETIRIQQALSLLNPSATQHYENVNCCPLGSDVDGNTVSYTIPNSGSGTAECQAFWGQGSATQSFGAGLNTASAPYALSYTVVGKGTFREVTVTAWPTTSTSYLGSDVQGKAVRYVAQIP